MSNLTLHTLEGDTQSLAIILVSDYLKLDLKIKVTSSPCDFQKSNTNTLPMLETQNGELIETASSILRYLVRTSTCQNLYNETSENITFVDQNLDLLNLELFRNLAVLQNKERETEKVDKLELASAKQNTIVTLKNLNSNLENSNLELNLSDFVLFVFLGSLLNNDVKKSLKGLKNLKSRWETVSKVEQFETLLRPYVRRVY